MVQPITGALALLLGLLPAASGWALAAQPSHVPGRAAWGQAKRLRSRPTLRRAIGDDDFTLPPENVVEAVAKAGTRVTVADVATAGGMKLAEAKKGLAQLAAAIGAEASLEVSRSGELVYVFPEDPQAALSKASSAAALRESINNAKPLLFTAARIAFGVALFASIAIIYTALIVISTSSSSDRRDDRRGGDWGDSYGDSYGGGGFGGGGFGGGFGFGPTLWYGPSPFDLFFYRPYYTYGGYEYDYQENREKPKMGFLEAVYSLVFGDGDPNAEREKKALAAVASTARKYNGVLTAEQLAPLLDPPEYKGKEGILVDEGWVLKALAPLNGRPEVTEDGQIAYVFDDLRSTAKDKREKPPTILEEKEVPFSMAEEGDLTLAGILGVVNVAGAAYLGAQFAGLPAGLALPGFLGFVKSIYPALLAYSVGFIAAPVARYLGLESTNKEIRERNEARQQWQRVLKSGQVDGKLAQARKLSQSMRQIDASDSVYSTSRGAVEQGNKNDMADFDRRLGGS